MAYALRMCVVTMYAGLLLACDVSNTPHTRSNHAPAVDAQPVDTIAVLANSLADSNPQLAERYLRSVLDSAWNTPRAVRQATNIDIETIYRDLAILAARTNRAQGARSLIDSGVARLRANSESYADLMRVRNQIDLIGTTFPPFQAPIMLYPGAKSMSRAERPTIVMFTAHWCGPCQEVYPVLRELASATSSAPVNIVVVSALYGRFGSRTDLSPAEEIRADSVYFREHGMADFAVVLDTAGAVADSLQVSGFPYIFVTDRDGSIRQWYAGWEDSTIEHMEAASRRRLLSAISRLPNTH